MKESDLRRTIPASGEGMRGIAGHLPYLLAHAHAAVRSALTRSFADMEVTVPQFAILTMIDSYPGVSCADLARLTNLTAQTINPMLVNLEGAGFITRIPDEVHGKIIRTFATQEGRRLRLQCRRRADRIERKLLADVRRNDQMIIRKWLVKIASDLQKEE
jgi:DNA-binding MarR family transcriptional regulator